LKQNDDAQNKSNNQDEVKQEPQIIFDVKISFSISDFKGENLTKGEAQLKLDEEKILILPKFKQPILIPLLDITGIEENDYKLILSLTSNEILTIFDLGYKYNDFARVLSSIYNETLLKRLLMQETLKKTGVAAEFIYYDNAGNEKYKGRCEPRLYETGLILLPEKGDLKRIPYSDISDIKYEDYKITINFDYGEKLILSQMGRDFESFVKTLSDTMNELALKVQDSMKELIPKANPLVLRKLAQFMKEGKAATRADIESISKDLWVELEKKIATAGIKDEYDFLKSMAQQQKMCIGLKRGLLGDLTGEYLWFLIPMYDVVSKDYGNAIAMEAITGEEGGKATYFFRIVSRGEYRNFKNIDDLHKKVDEFIKKINRCMLAINFRREPIYLPDERLQEPQYQKYLYAIAKIPELKELRELFIGRVIHSSFEKWKSDVIDLLKFNITETEDNLKWKRMK